MKIRTRFTLMTAALIGTVVAAIAVTVTRAQRSVLEAQSRERLDALGEGVARIAQESLDNRDQLMLMSYLMYLRKDHPELAYAAVTRHERTWTLGDAAPGLTYWSRAITARHPVKVTVAAQSTAAPRLSVSSAGVSLASSGNALVSVAEGPASSLELKLGFVTRALDDEIARQLRPLAAQTLAIAAAFMLLGWLGAASLAQHLASPLLALSAAVGRVGQRGNFDVAVPARSKDEVGVLAARFNEMTARIKELLQGREDILHTLSHELNTPLSGLKGYLELWQTRGLPADLGTRREVLETMMAAVLRMENSLGSALKLFAAEAAAPAEARVVWVDDLIRQVCTLFAPIASSKRICVETPPPGATEWLYADEELLRKVVTNLVSNALKYTPDGGRVVVSLKGAPDRLCFEVRDTGYGIKAEDLPHLFTKFYRSAAGQAGRERIPGTGLGLSIVGQAVKALGGRVSVESALGKGSVFTVVIPRAPMPKPEAV